jgi:hypothetical protein
MSGVTVMDDDLTTLEDVLRDRAALVPHLQEAPPTMLARARRRVVRNALASATAAGLIVVAASAGLASLRAPQDGGPGGTPTPAPSASTCIAADLRATATLDGAAGSVLGSIDLTNVGDRTCTLEGRPTVLIFDASGHELSPQVIPDKPQWEVDGASPPRGWPVVSLRPGSVASIRILVSNLCPQLDGPPTWTIDLTSGRGSLDVADADAITPSCLGTAEPSRLEIGPFEPGGEG